MLTRTLKKIEAKSGGLKRKVRDRMRSIRKRVMAIALSTRLMGEKGEARRKREKPASPKLNRTREIDFSAT